MIKKTILVLLALVLLLAMIGSVLTQRYECSRSVVIQAPTEKIFARIGDLESWPEWDPFREASEREHLNLKTTPGEKSSGIGASQSWSSDRDNGRLSFTECDPKTGIAYDVVFTNGERESPAQCRMRMNPRPNGSVELVWSIHGEMNMPVIGGFFARIADRKLGPMFERGLNKLKAQAEAR